MIIYYPPRMFSRQSTNIADNPESSLHHDRQHAERSGINRRESADICLKSILGLSVI